METADDATTWQVPPYVSVPCAVAHGSRSRRDDRRRHQDACGHALLSTRPTCSLRLAVLILYMPTANIGERISSSTGLSSQDQYRER